MKKQFFSLILALILLVSAVSALPLTVTAAEEDGISFSAAYLLHPSTAYNSTPNTFEAWINLPKNTAGNRAGIILGNYGDASPCINFEIHTNGRPRLFWSAPDGTTDYVFTNVNVCTGDWLHLTIVRDNDEGKVHCYVNGELAQTLDSKKTKDLICIEPYVVGGDMRAENSMYFRGKIRSVAVYSEVRTEDEILEDMIEPEMNDSLLAYYELDGAAGAEEVEDLSGNGYDLRKLKAGAWVMPADKEQITDFDYSFVAVGDTQVLAQKHKDRFNLIYDWILDHESDKNIQFVMGLGDITETSSQDEWDIAMENILRLEGKIPFSLVRGNHDSVASFNRAFPYDKYDYLVDGTYDNSMINSWQTFSVGERNFIVFTLDYGASDAVLNWAGEIIENHPEHNVIITTHAYLFRDGTTLDQGDVCPPATTGGHNNGDHMWDKLIKKHENIVLVINGHDPSSRIVTSQDKGDNGNIVTQMLIDPQGVDASLGGLGMVAVLHFSEDSNEMQVEYYSTFQQKYFKAANQFTVTLDFVGEDAKENDPPATDEPPADEPPADEPPADEPPADEPPADEPPADESKEPDTDAKDEVPADDSTDEPTSSDSSTLPLTTLIIVVVVAILLTATITAILVMLIMKKKSK